MYIPGDSVVDKLMDVFVRVNKFTKDLYFFLCNVMKEKRRIVYFSKDERSLKYKCENI